jgi:D-serine deaminase-like pyridoxal phosphate-dependent protein
MLRSLHGGTAGGPAPLLEVPHLGIGRFLPGGQRVRRRREQGSLLRPGPDENFGLILGAPDSKLHRLNEEHGHVDLARGTRLALGDQVRILPNHACAVANRFEELIVVQND